MSILTTAEVAGFLGMDPSADGLSEAIQQAEQLTAAKMRLRGLELGGYTEDKLITFPRQQVMPNNGPVQDLTAFTVDGEDRLSDVEVSGNKWAITWSDPVTVFQFGRARSFKNQSRVIYTYKAGWTDQDGDYPLPAAVSEAIKSMTGLVYLNLLGSGVYDTKLGDMTIKIQRETLEQNRKIYDSMIGMYGRPY